MNCKANKFLYLNNCIAICPPGYFSNSATLTCTSCHSSCLTCSAGLDSNCLTCYADNYLTDLSAGGVTIKKCLTNVVDGFFVNLNTNALSNCNANCKTCTLTSTNCLTCATNKYYTTTSIGGSCSNSCVGAFYADATTFTC